VLTLIGVCLRLNAHSMAWPTQFSFSGPASDTPWAHQEYAIGQIGLALMFAGILIFVVTYFYWLFDKQSDK
jgi:hypothetical protein